MGVIPVDILALQKKLQASVDLGASAEATPSDLDVWPIRLTFSDVYNLSMIVNAYVQSQIQRNEPEPDESDD
jgi:hypothetical protein